MDIVAILGADTPPMQAIEGLLTEAGVPFVYGLHGGERVRQDTAYRTDDLSEDIPPDAEVWVVEGDGPAIDALRKAGHEVVVIDHHRPGDPGYGRPPSEFMQASSIGQVISQLAVAGPLPARWERETYGTIKGNVGQIFGALYWQPDGTGKLYCVRHNSRGCRHGNYWVVDRGAPSSPYGACVLTSVASGACIPKEYIFAAAADHCLAAAYRGECPDVDPDELMRWREDQ